MNINDEGWFYTSDGMYYGKIININEFRPPEMKYAIEVYKHDGYLPDDGLIFVGDENMIRIEEIVL